MSRHYIELPAALAAGMAAVVCGYDRLPRAHYFCNVSESMEADHIDEPLWASIFDSNLMFVTDADGFDSKLASMGITLPESVKDALREDWESETINRVVFWKTDGTVDRDCG